VGEFEWSQVRLIGLCGKAGAGKDTFYEHVLKPKGYLRWPMTLHDKTWLVATGRATFDEAFVTKPPRVRQILQDEITQLRYAWSESIWLNVCTSWMISLQSIVGVHVTHVAVTDLRFLIEMRGLKALGGKILHLEAADQQANVALGCAAIAPRSSSILRKSKSDAMPLSCITQKASAR
jgi:hypothetical protein